ncbi:predicted protein [Nematostella vectensis]|uniref:Laminin G domain-containing protein n=1 Tax=Nematostella vectensis TaxID=45351 RepID=A7RM12_NEMVE|nr:predicted protein [Nematostella vectensis]|eukprot:XP_001639488.1 predicted protein [Nematostella vectensis]
MLRNFVFCAFLFAVVLHHCRCASKSKNSSRTFFKYGYAVYKPGWSLDYDGYLQMYFKTEKQDAMLLYQDDSHEAGQFMDIFLVNGKLRLRMAIGSCSYAERTVNGSFSDLKWHKLVIRRELEETVVSVDNITTEPIKCSAQLSKMVAMYAGYLTLSQRREGSWVFPTAFWQSMQHGSGYKRDTPHSVFSKLSVKEYQVILHATFSCLRNVREFIIGFSPRILLGEGHKDGGKAKME